MKNLRGSKKQGFGFPSGMPRADKRLPHDSHPFPQHIPPQPLTRLTFFSGMTRQNRELFRGEQRRPEWRRVAGAGRGAAASEIALLSFGRACYNRSSPVRNGRFS